MRQSTSSSIAPGTTAQNFTAPATPSAAEGQASRAGRAGMPLPKAALAGLWPRRPDPGLKQQRPGGGYVVRVENSECSIIRRAVRAGCPRCTHPSYRPEARMPVLANTVSNRANDSAAVVPAAFAPRPRASSAAVSPAVGPRGVPLAEHLLGQADRAAQDRRRSMRHIGIPVRKPGLVNVNSLMPAPALSAAGSPRSAA